ncbi:MAG TPA: hypothetical protein VMO26_12640 [Vicinamibacterales bacterium]|nr:hypothetical protein [Vicinamibacterales bacterium]
MDRIRHVALCVTTLLALGAARNFLDFALLTTGVTRDVRTGDLSFAGQRGTLNSLVVDGADTNNTFSGQTLGRTARVAPPINSARRPCRNFRSTRTPMPPSTAAPPAASSTS